MTQFTSPLIYRPPSLWSAASGGAIEQVGMRLRRCKRRLRDHNWQRADNLDNMAVSMFRKISLGDINMIYRRAGGNIGWVDPRVSRGVVPKGN